MDIIKWLELAKSKDKSRPNLNHVYRDTNALVATDGHRLHVSNGLPDTSPHFLGSADNDLRFPEWSRVMNNAEADRLPLSLGFMRVGDGYKQNLTFYKRIATLIKPFDRSMLARLRIQNNIAELAIKHPEFSITMPLPCQITGELDEEYEVGFNFLYFYEALRLLEVCNVEILLPQNPLAPILFKGDSHKAVVMPMRLE